MAPAGEKGPVGEFWSAGATHGEIIGGGGGGLSDGLAVLA
jgi:hypothetical protein